jgi:hypothetical protein
MRRTLGTLDEAVLRIALRPDGIFGDKISDLEGPLLREEANSISNRTSGVS